MKRSIYVFSAIFIIICVLLFALYRSHYCYNTYNLKINKLSLNESLYRESAYYIQSIEDFDKPKNCDKNGIVLVKYDDSLFYNPVTISQYGLNFLNEYYITNDDRYLKKATAYAQFLTGLAKKQNGALYFPYNFNFALNDGKDTLKAPWYSSMAQGQALALFSRLYGITKNNYFKKYADSVFKSLTEVAKYEIPVPSFYVSRVDSSNFLWFEEYPYNPHTSALNGFIFTIYGLYDYYINVRPHKWLVKHFLLASMTTVKKYIERYRNPEGISYYYMKHTLKNEFYHTVHIEQLKQLYRITSDPYFKRMADTLRSDYWPVQK